MQNNKPGISPYLMLVAGILALSMTSIFVRWAQAPGTVTAAYRMLFSTIALTPFMIAKGLPKITKTSSLGWLLPLAGLFVALDHATMNTAIGMTRIANSTLLNNLAPLWVALFALLVWREKLKKGFWIGLALTLTGAAVILGMDIIHNPHLSLGDGFAFSSSYFYAGYFLLTQSSRSKLPTLQYIWMVNLVSASLLFAYNFIAGIPVTGFSPLTWLVFAGAGIVSQTIGYFSVAHALGHLPASIVSPTMVIQIVITALIAIPLTGEGLAWTQVLGGVTILAGILIINLTRNRSVNKTPGMAEEQPVKQTL